MIEHLRKKYACKTCQTTIKLTKQLLAPIPRSIAASGLLSHVLVSKFQDHLPLHRQETILKRIGVDIPRTTLSLWVIKCAELLRPLLKLMHDCILTYDIAYADETTTQVLKEPSKGVQSKKYMWLFANSVDGANAAATIFSIIETCKDLSSFDQDGDRASVGPFTQENLPPL